MLRLAVSNIGFQWSSSAATLNRLVELEIAAIEIAPSRVWNDTWRGLTPIHVQRLQREVSEAGLSVVGLHSLFFDHPELGLFRDSDGRRRTLDFLVHLSAVCRDLGGKTLIWGGGRRRGSVERAAAQSEAIGFIGELCRLVESHGTCFCFEPLGPSDSDFINSAYEAFDIAQKVNHPAFAVQLDAKALVANGEAEFATFSAVRHRLVHFHANEPDLGVLGTSGQVAHAALGGWLRQIGYTGYVSLEQRQLDPDHPLRDIERSIDVLTECYL